LRLELPTDKVYVPLKIPHPCLSVFQTDKSLFVRATVTVAFPLDLTSTFSKPRKFLMGRLSVPLSGIGNVDLDDFLGVDGTGILDFNGEFNGLVLEIEVGIEKDFDGLDDQWCMLCRLYSTSSLIISNLI
jgi:hypothetical protein